MRQSRKHWSYNNRAAFNSFADRNDQAQNGYDLLDCQHTSGPVYSTTFVTFAHVPPSKTEQDSQKL
jgi:hypothetical protein